MVTLFVASTWLVLGAASPPWAGQGPLEIYKVRAVPGLLGDLGWDVVVRRSNVLQ